MTIKAVVRKLLMDQDKDKLIDLLEEDRRVVTALNRLLFDDEPLIRWRAVKGLGWVAAHDPYVLEKIIGRLVYTMNDDAGQVGWMAPQALGEICANDPDLVEDFFPIVISSHEIRAFRSGAAWAIGRVAGVRPDLVEDVCPLLVELLRDSDPEVRAAACLAIGEVGCQNVRLDIERLLNDDSVVIVYQDDMMVKKTVAETAGAVLAGI